MKSDAESKARLIREMLQSGKPIEASEVLNSELTRRLSEQRVTLRAQLADPHTPAVWRMELGKVLQHFQEMDLPLLEKLLDPANPASLRLIANLQPPAHSRDLPARRRGSIRRRAPARAPAAVRSISIPP